MESLLKYIHSLTEFSAESWALLQPALSKKRFKKNEFLLREGQVCNSLFFIEKGYCRSYYEIDGLEKNTSFFLENDIATNIKSFGSGQKSATNIIACESLSAIIFDKEKLFQASKQAPEIEALGRNCIRLFATKQEEFATLFNLYSAQDRLAYIEKNHPQLLQRVSQTQLASFLGIARETVSRIRKRRTHL
jgi:CRP-like cAMP-binding protein